MNEIIETTVPEVIMPGCYGYVSTFDASEACKQCNVSLGCLDKTGETLQKMQERRMDVRKLVAQHRSFSATKNKVSPLEARHEVGLIVTRRAPVIAELTEEQKKKVEGLSIKAGAELRKLYERGIPFESDLRAGRNPITASGGRPAFLEVAFDALLEGGFTRLTLRERYINKFSWEVRTATSHVTIVTGLFPALGVREDMGVFKL